VSEPFEPDQAEELQVQPRILARADGAETLPALAGDGRALTPRSAAPPLPQRSPGLAMPAVQAAAVAAGGFIAGVAVVGLVHRRQRRSAALGRGRRSGRALAGGGRAGAKAGDLLEIVGSRSLLVDVHLLGGRGGER
jgi:hypothetical protein